MNRIVRFVLLSMTLLALTLPFTHTIFAQGGPASGGNPTTGTGGPASGGNPVSETSGTGLTNPLNKIDSLPAFLNAILDAIVQIGTIVLTLAIVYVGFMFVRAQGNEEGIRTARSALMWTVIGGLVLLGAKTIGLVISSTVNTL